MEKELFYQFSNVKIETGSRPRHFSDSCSLHELFFNSPKKYVVVLKPIDKKLEEVLKCIVIQDFFDTCDEKEKLICIKSDVEVIKYMNPLLFTEKLILAILRKDGNYIKNIDLNSYKPKVSQKFCLAAVKQDGNAIQHIKNPSDEIKLAAVIASPKSIIHILDYFSVSLKSSDETEKEAIFQLILVSVRNGYFFNVIKDKIDFLSKDKIKEIQFEAIKTYPHVIKDIENPSDEMKIEAIKKDVDVIKYIKDPSDEMLLLIIDKSPYYINELKDPSEIMIKTALNSKNYKYTAIKSASKVLTLTPEFINGKLEQFIDDNTSRNTKMSALKKNVEHIKHFKTQTDSMQIEYIDKYFYAGFNPFHIKTPSEEVQLKMLTRKDQSLSSYEYHCVNKLIILKYFKGLGSLTDKVQLELIEFSKNRQDEKIILFILDYFKDTKNEEIQLKFSEFVKDIKIKTTLISLKLKSIKSIKTN